ncbi:Crp/Fnr family transcriptional regulator [Dyadobacter sp. CY356]|uniref:Crp/Fnr family transcriptional regulator n=1 Tax=Dyadobacter sp. CY356 TaxID=2906442 RepID=UPI001F197905|nr:Crp/Fnr family transcriptional regulator [Dyadobacter sp. CY356]MCF0055232.1 Crp/Fnr family transcriptional regulator [Dyadobacter sp. CY356]
MTNQEKIASYLEKFVHLTENEIIEFTSRFKEIRVKKRQFIVQPDFVPKSRYFVIKGALRAYVVGDEGKDHTIQFAIEDWWISDYDSYIHQQPASMFVVALEDCILMQISFEDEQTLKALNHKFETFFRYKSELSTAFLQRRIITNLTKSAKERYDIFTESFPKLVQRVPQYALASYLGITTQFLSKIRNLKPVPNKS